jgi:hypothetical protein
MIYKYINKEFFNLNMFLKFNNYIFYVLEFEGFIFII